MTLDSTSTPPNDEPLAERTCSRCGHPLGERGYCTGNCPFDAHSQACMKGWAGRPEQDPHPRGGTDALECTCGGRPTGITSEGTPEEGRPAYWGHFTERYQAAIKDPETKLSFLFRIFDGPERVGLNARIVAPTPPRAIEKAKRMLEDFKGHESWGVGDYSAEYLSLGLRPAAIGLGDIVFSETRIRG